MSATDGEPLSRLQEADSACEPTDAALVAAAADGSAWAVQQLFCRHYKLAKGLAIRLMGNEIDADDVVQESFVQALTGISKLADGQAFRAWICTIVARTAARALRRFRGLEKLGMRSADAADLDNIAGVPTVPDTRIELEQARRIINSFPPQTRLVLLLNRVDELSHDEIGRALAISNATVRRRLEDARRALAREEQDK